MTPADKLRSFNSEFEKTIFALSDSVYLAVGYAASNVGLIIGDEGLIIIDTTESTKAAENILAEFRKITDAPVKTIIYTHSHRDHISGASVFAEGRAVEVVAHRDFSSDLVGTSDAPGPGAILVERAKRQFGIGLEFGTERINIGLGPGDRPLEGLGQGHIPPNTLVLDDGETLSRCGRMLELSFAPGECADALSVFLPDDKILFSADNYYAGFPNLYAIRGTAYRPFDVWAESLAKLARFKPEVLAPGHSKPLFGADTIAHRLQLHEEAIRYVIAACDDGMNLGMGLDDLVEYVQLPEHLRHAPSLYEYYGTLEWSVRAYFTGHLGWFDGDPANLFPLAPENEAAKIAALAGGPEQLAKAAAKALSDGDAQWALDLVGRVLRLDPQDRAARYTRIKALRELGEGQSNACARNYYLSTAKQEEATLVSSEKGL